MFAVIQFLIPTSFILLSYGAVGGWQMAPFDAFNDAGLFGAMGFCGAYVLISLATPFYLKKIGELKAHHIAIAVIALALLIVPIVGTVYPVPPSPLNYFPYIFLPTYWPGSCLVSVRSRSIIGNRRHPQGARRSRHGAGFRSCRAGGVFRRSLSALLVGF